MPVPETNDGGADNKNNNASDVSPFLSPPGQPYNPAELQRQFVSGMSARDVYALLCKRGGCKPISAVSAMLPEKPSVWDVPSLDLSRTYVGHRGVVPIMELCKLLTKLTSLNLSNNFLTNKSVWHICHVAMYHPTIQQLDLSDNDVSWTAGMCALELAVKNPSVQYINLSGTLIKPKVVEAIQQQLRRSAISGGASGGQRVRRRGPNSSNHPTAIRQRALKRFFKDIVAREGNAAAAASVSTAAAPTSADSGGKPKAAAASGQAKKPRPPNAPKENDNDQPPTTTTTAGSTPATTGNIGPKVAKRHLIDGYKEVLRLSGQEDQLQKRSPAFFDAFLKRAPSEAVDWETFMVLIMVEDVPFHAESVDLLRRVFTAFDTDQSGYVEMSDLPDLMTAVFGHAPSSTEVASKMAFYAADDTMTMTWDEFLLLFYEHGPVVGEMSTYMTHTPLKRTRSLHH